MECPVIIPTYDEEGILETPCGQDGTHLLKVYLGAGLSALLMICDEHHDSLEPKVDEVLDDALMGNPRLDDPRQQVAPQ